MLTSNRLWSWPRLWRGLSGMGRVRRSRVSLEVIDGVGAAGGRVDQLSDVVVNAGGQFGGRVRDAAARHQRAASSAGVVDFPRADVGRCYQFLPPPNAKI